MLPHITGKDRLGVGGFGIEELFSWQIGTTNKLINKQTIAFIKKKDIKKKYKLLTFFLAAQVCIATEPLTSRYCKHSSRR